MPHGTPDWGLVGPKHITYGLDDLGEHAVRVGSPHLWDRRGDVLYITDFREGLGMCASVALGGGGDVRLATGHSRHGAYSVDLVAGSDGQHRAYLQLALPFQDASCVGLEFSFSVAAESSDVRALIGWYDGAWWHEAIVRYNYVGLSVDYETAGGAWQVLEAGVSRHECSRPEHTMKLVVDMVENEYVRFLLDERAYDMRGTAIRSVGSVMSPYWDFVVQHTGVLTFTPGVYVDNLIVTQNEPR